VKWKGNKDELKDALEFTIKLVSNAIKADAEDIIHTVGPAVLTVGEVSHFDGKVGF
jgi:hypothetical protein